jgi:hypothetical protein
MVWYNLSPSAKPLDAEVNHISERDSDIPDRLLIIFQFNSESGGTGYTGGM